MALIFGERSIIIGVDATCASVREPVALELKFKFSGELNDPISTPFKKAINPSSIVTLNSPPTALFFDLSN